MTSTLTVGLAQLAPIKCNIPENLTKHIELVKQAAKKQVELLIFPELSLTGYEPEVSADFAMTYEAQPLRVLHNLANKHSMTILVSAPLRVESTAPELGLVILSPDAPISHYSKIHLHGIENEFFSAGKEQMLLSMKGFSIGLAICADTTHPEHIQHVVNAGADCYLASLLISEQGYSADATMFMKYAQQHNIMVGISNFVGQSGPYKCAGKSTFWNTNGEVVAQADDAQETIITTTLSK